MARGKSTFKEGDWFTVPLKRGRALGLVARKDRGGNAFLGYYFNGNDPPGNDMSKIETFSPRDAILITASGTYGLRSGTWQVIGSSRTWSRDAWPIPRFVRTDPSGVEHFETYGDDDVLLPMPADRGPSDPRLCQRVVAAELFDAGAVEEHLWQILRTQ